MQSEFLCVVSREFPDNEIKNGEHTDLTDRVKALQQKARRKSIISIFVPTNRNVGSVISCTVAIFNVFNLS